jgi:hypothetical protein
MWQAPVAAELRQGRTHAERQARTVHSFVSAGNSAKF